MLRRTHRSSSPRAKLLGAAIVMVLIVAGAGVWFSRLVDTDAVKSACAPASKSMTQAIEARVRDHRTHLDRVRIAEAGDSRFENLFFTSANVRVAGVFVGVGTWASNVSGFGPGDFRGWDHTPTYYAVSPANDLARAISGSGNGRAAIDPGMTRAAKFSQDCVTRVSYGRK